jgi:pimeloyl-[acyl-carrier protein] methyl ester esterase
MKEKIELILQHGWGFDGGAWDGWRTHLIQSPEHEMVIHRAERGYFGIRKFSPQFSNTSGRKVLIAHSTGLHFLDKEVLASADVIVLISSYLKFHSGDHLEQRRSRRSLRLMMDKLEQNPSEVLDDFYGNCYHPLLTRQVLLRRSTEMERLNVKQLYEDLELIDQSDLDPSFARGEVLILHGESDKVVSPTQAYHLQREIAGSSMIMFEGVGHALPFTHVAPCWLSVRNALRSVLPVGSV